MAHWLTFPRIQDPRGNLSFAQQLPFPVLRCYWIYGIEPEAVRGGHAHKTLERILIPVSGSLVASVDGFPYSLYQPWMGLYIGPLEWLDMKNFAHGTACMVLASAEYSEADYIREYDTYLRIKRGL